MEIDFGYWLSVANEAMKDEAMHRWAAETLAVWLRAGCCCAYCKVDLLLTRDAAYFGQQTDHILPKSRYPNLKKSFSNLTLACTACNRLKLGWYPNKENAVFDGAATELTPPQREEAIRRTQLFLAEKRRPLEAEFLAELAVIRPLLGKRAAVRVT